jgi:hypothetical protein
MKKLLWLVAIVLLVGIWFGMNLAKNKPLFSNPFQDKTLQERAAETAKDIYSESKDALKRQLGN